MGFLVVVVMDFLVRRLRERGRELDLSNAEIARRCGLSERRYGHYVTGAREPNLATLLRICATLATTPNDLLGVGEGAESWTGEEHGSGRQERRKLTARLVGALNLLEIDDLRLVVKQVETLFRHRRERQQG
jgi:transcriptional regulator with XRE-family HTH domain